MAARDLYHAVVVEALQKDGWSITDDPLYLDYDSRDLYVDLGAERDTIGAVKGKVRIAVEIKTFSGLSIVADAQKALGQYTMYETVLEDIDPERVVYLAIPKRIYEGFFSERLGRQLIKHRKLRIVVYDQTQTEIVTWINWHLTDESS